MNKKILILFMLQWLLMPITAQISYRQRICLNNGWSIKPAYNTSAKGFKEGITLPHTWNANHVFEGADYERTMMIYRRDLNVRPEWKGKRLFLYFEGVNAVAHVLVNKKSVGSHYGGYTGFCLEITDQIKADRKNMVEVYVSNEYRTDLIPLSGDFNIYGGIHRPVYLLVTEPNCISPLHFGSTGVYIQQKKISREQANFEVSTIFSLLNVNERLTVKTTVMNANRKILLEKESPLTRGQTEIHHSFSLPTPILWNGKKNPYLYRVRVQLVQKGRVIDEITERTGFRSFHVDSQQGFFLNDSYLNLYGFGLHEDYAGKGSALADNDYRTDMQIILESGATSMRLTHYPHRKIMYDLCDEAGIVLWTEIPFVGPGGYDSPGFLDSEKLKEHVRSMLLEMIYQRFNHPSICFWGIFNEQNQKYDDPVPFIRELNTLVHRTDPSRLTTFATCVDQQRFLGCADVFAWNQYKGWYGGMPSEIGTFMDEVLSRSEGTPVGLSEYGAGANVTHHEFPVRKPNPVGKFHPEEWQTLCHEQHWEQLYTRPFVWGKYIWNFADFSSAIRYEGDMRGINDKGLITYDRQIKKDAFYFYKANWSKEPMIYIANRRFIERTDSVINVKVFTNKKNATLFVNGKRVGKKKCDILNRIVWKNIPLLRGENTVHVITTDKGRIVSDTCKWVIKIKQ